MNGIFIEYGDISIGAKESFGLVDNGNQKDGVSNSNQLKENISNFGNYTNPIELYNTILDGESLAIPKDNKDINIGFWGNKLSENDGSFNDPIELIFVSDKKFSSTGIQFNFDVPNNVFPTSMSIYFYEDDVIKINEILTPKEPIYFYNKLVENYNKIILTINSINMPKTSLKMKSIEFGFMRRFGGEKIKKCYISDKTNLISSEFPISNSEIIFNNVEDLFFQKNQPIVIYLDDEFQSKTYIKKIKRKSKGEWSIKAENFVGLLDETKFYGGVYNEYPAVNLIKDIFETAGIKYKIDNEIITEEEKLSGYIPIGSCRKSLQLVLFSIGAICIDEYSEGVILPTIKKPSYEIKQTIDKKRVMQDAYIDEDDELSSVSVDYHIYSSSSDEADSQIIYEANSDEENILITFKEPMSRLVIVPDGGGEIIESNANYAIINIRNGYSLKGYKYFHNKVTKTKINDKNYSGNGKKIVISNSTLVSKSNIDKVIDRCYNYYVKNRCLNAKIIEGFHLYGRDLIRYGEKKYKEFKYKQRSELIIEKDKRINIADMLIVPTEFQDEFSGNVESQKFYINSSKSILKTIVSR